MALKSINALIYKHIGLSDQDAFIDDPESFILQNTTITPTNRAIHTTIMFECNDPEKAEEAGGEISLYLKLLSPTDDDNMNYFDIHFYSRSGDNCDSMFQLVGRPQWRDSYSYLDALSNDLDDIGGSGRIALNIDFEVNPDAGSFTGTGYYAEISNLASVYDGASISLDSLIDSISIQFDVAAAPYVYPDWNIYNSVTSQVITDRMVIPNPVSKPFKFKMESNDYSDESEQHLTAYDSSGRELINGPWYLGQEYSITPDSNNSITVTVYSPAAEQGGIYYYPQTIRFTLLPQGTYISYTSSGGAVNNKFVQEAYRRIANSGTNQWEKLPYSH